MKKAFVATAKEGHRPGLFYGGLPYNEVLKLSIRAVGMTQLDVAKALNITEQRVNRLLNGRDQLDDETTMRIEVLLRSKEGK